MVPGIIIYSVATTLATHGKYRVYPINKRVSLPGIPEQYSQQVKNSDRLTNDTPAPVKTYLGVDWKVLEASERHLPSGQVEPQLLLSHHSN